MLRNKLVLGRIALGVLLSLCSPAFAQSYAITPIPQGELPEYAALVSESKLFSSSSSETPSEGERNPLEVPPINTRLKSTRDSDRPGPFSSVYLGFKASTLGAGFELATPITPHFGLRGQFNTFAFSYLFNIDGVDYDSRFNLNSGSISMDWYPTRHGFRISPGILYFKNNLNAVSGVPAGNYFELGSQGFINSVDDPLNGDAAVLFSRHIAPMVTFGYNLIGGKEGRITMPIEVGFAYTGPAKIDVTLNGTACTNEGCFTFADNQEAQQSMQEEIAKLNRNLSNYPIYPVVSLGLSYRFGRR